ncbi:MAG: hypothetical protein QOC57_2261 [Ilumatobacteraceae bacterium]|nr:hypothetical protein [Ilumatobacteraceae bacterium]
MKSLVILPGHAPRWVADHARHLAQRLTETGRVMVVFTDRRTGEALLPGQPGNGSVLGHSVAGYPMWMGRRSAALGLRRSSKFTIVVLWAGASNLLAVWAGLVARLRRERLILDIPEFDYSPLSRRERVARGVLRRLAEDVVHGTPAPQEDRESRVILMLCGDFIDMARLALQTFEGMADSAASRWTLRLQVGSKAEDLVWDAKRRIGRVSTDFGAPTAEMLRRADVVVADYDGPYADLVRQSVLSGGAGVLVGHPVAGRVARCHDGVWLAQRDSAAILVALEASSGDVFRRPVPVATMRELTDQVVNVVFDKELVG